MLKVYDTECMICGNIFEQFVENENEFNRCPFCGGVDLKKIISKMTFKLIYDNKTDMCAWGSDNYETSQYWSKVREARERGEDVKAVNEA